jgi:predicted amidohydrolase YtcJ
LATTHFPAIAAEEPVDVIFHGGTIYSFSDDEGGAVEAIALAGSRVAASGSLEELNSLAGGNARLIDLQGATLLPGLVDAHAHLFNLGRFLQQAQLRGTVSAEDCIERAKESEATLPEGAWLIGRGWDQNDWEVKEYPDASALDAVFGDRPVYLRRVDGHAAWVNSAALRAAGIDRSTPDPEGGEIVRDPETGAATGIVIDAAEDIVSAAIPEESAEELDRIVALATADARAKGLVGVHEMGVDVEEWGALRRAESNDQLSIRIVAFLGGEEELDKFEGGPVRPDASSRLRLEGVKLYADGALGSRGAALLAEYSDRPGHMGLMQSSEKVLTRAARKSIERGFSVALHAIGDRGNRIGLAAIANGHAEAKAGRPGLPELAELRCRIEHAQIVHPDDIPRFAELGILPSMQPTHCTSDMPWAPVRLGESRLEGAYAWRSFRESGTIVPLGSDFPVEKVSPLLGIYAALTRQQPDGEPEGGWSPAQRLDPSEAVLGFTAWAADACGVAEWGRLRPGDQADITILSVDPMKADPAEVLNAKIVGTVVGGEMSAELR